MSVGDVVVHGGSEGLGGGIAALFAAHLGEQVHDDDTAGDDGHADHGGGVRVLAVKRHPQRGDHQNAGAGPGGVGKPNGNVFYRAGEGVVAGAIEQHEQTEQQHLGGSFTAAKHLEGGGGRGFGHDHQQHP